MPLSRVMAWTQIVAVIAIIVLSVSLATGIGTGFLFLVGVDWMILIASLVLIHSFAAYGSARALESARFPMLMQSGLAAGLLSLLGSLLLLAYGFRFSSTFNIVLAKCIVTGTVGALWCGQWGRLYLRRRVPRSLGIMRTVTMGCATVCGVVLVWTAWSEQYAWPPVMDTSAFVVLTTFTLFVFGSVVCKILSQVHLLAGESEELPASEVLPFVAVCPRCGETQRLQTGSGRCGSCALRITVIAP